MNIIMLSDWSPRPIKDEVEFTYPVAYLITNSRSFHCFNTEAKIISVFRHELNEKIINSAVFTALCFTPVQQFSYNCTLHHLLLLTDSTELSQTIAMLRYCCVQCSCIINQPSVIILQDHKQHITSSMNQLLHVRELICKLWLKGEGLFHVISQLAEYRGFSTYFILKSTDHHASFTGFPQI